MELFYAYKIEDGFAWLDTEESTHCVRVLRHKAGDEINVIDGSGSLLHCILKEPSPMKAVAQVMSTTPNWGAHPYYLRMAVCPTKNIDRYEWFVEKAVELGVDEIVPVIGEHSERRVVRVDRLQKIAISAAKQSLKGRIPHIAESISVLDFISSTSGTKLIAYCSDDVAPRGSIIDALAAACESVSTAGECVYRAPSFGARTRPFPTADGKAAAYVTILVGPEGDFSQSEVQAAIAAGFEPVHLGPSRLRTETAAITAVEAAYLTLGLGSTPYNSQ